MYVVCHTYTIRRPLGLLACADGGNVTGKDHSLWPVRIPKNALPKTHGVVLSGVARNGCHVYLDDFLVFGRTLEEHNRNLGRVFDRIRKAGLRLQPKKCVFAQLSVEYLGHLVSEKGIQTSPEKVVALESYRTPADLKALRSFIGFASNYRRFVPGFSKIASPLYALTKKCGERRASEPLTG